MDYLLQKLDWNDERNKDPNYVERFDTLLYEDIQYNQLSHERKRDILHRYPLSQNFGYQTWNKHRGN